MALTNPQQYVVYPGSVSASQSDDSMTKMMNAFMPLIIMIMMMSMITPMMKSMSSNI